MHFFLRLFFIVCILYPYLIFSFEENFIVLEGISGSILLSQGNHVEEQISPGSTFKIALCLIGFEANILENEDQPVWKFQEDYDDYLDSWQTDQSPKSWMKNSCVWYSRLITKQLGMEKILNELSHLNYGNQDFSGGLTQAWLSSSLKISPIEQAIFIRNLNLENYRFSKKTIEITQQLLFIEDLPNGWKLYGKTGLTTLNLETIEKLPVGHFVGWIEKESEFFPFAYQRRDSRLDLSQRISRVKYLLASEIKCLE